MTEAIFNVVCTRCVFIAEVSRVNLNINFCTFGFVTKCVCGFEKHQLPICAVQCFNQLYTGQCFQHFIHVFSTVVSQARCSTANKYISLQI